MILLAPSDPLALVVARAAFAVAPTVVVRTEGYRGLTAIGAVGCADSLDDVTDPAVDRDAFAAALSDNGVASADAVPLARAVADREAVVDLAAGRGSRASSAYARAVRPPTLFERAALEDVLGCPLAALLPMDRVEVERARLRAGALNHCELGADGVARIRLIDTNGVTLAARVHAALHELGHALIGLARESGKHYGKAYGSPDYGRFLDPGTFGEICDEEAWVRSMSNAWLLRRPGVTWARTWPGAVDEVARDLNADDLAAFARFRLAQGLGLEGNRAPVVVRRGGAVA